MVRTAFTPTTVLGSMLGIWRACKVANVRDDMVDAYAGEFLVERSTRMAADGDLPCVAKREATSATMQYMVGGD